ncbi:MAG: class II aldolase/adducin family protein [Bacteroidota bacterium]|nr:class II aldolase/adducin family protein [Bacteroidota bacterium]
MSEEKGYIKFNCDWEKKNVISEKEIEELNEYRDKLYYKNLIGAFENKVGFGNISERIKGTNKFIITASKTGNFKKLLSKNYSKVTEFDIDKNTVKCYGLSIASSESLAHGAIYEAKPDINSVIHIHDFDIWKKYLDKLPTTDKSALFGTSEMANEIKRILKSEKLNPKVIVMGGHEEGIISFGKNIEDAFNELMKIFN